jgi:uncharacterized protein (DUF1697 family)
MAARREYVAFLRAVNVGGRFVTMERLRAEFEALGLDRVRSYIQSGNVFFETAQSSRDALARKIEKHLFAELGFECPVFLRTIQELEKTLATDAFRGLKSTPVQRLAVLFVSEPLPKKVSLPYRSPKGDCDVLAATPGELFVVVRQAVGRPGNPVAQIEKAFGIRATARFYDTALKILDAARLPQGAGGRGRV